MLRSPQIAICVATLLACSPARGQVPARVANTTLQMPAEAFGSVAYRMENLRPGDVGNPVAMASPPGDSRLFVLDRNGRIMLIPDLDNPVSEVFLDLSSRVEAGFLEEGLLGLAFHPDYANNRKFYVFFTEVNPAADRVHNDTLSCFLADADDPDRGDLSSEVVLIREPGGQFARNHNGGDLHFGSDGYLYISLGDGGNWNNAQKIDDDFYAGLLRIDVDQRPGNLAPNPHPSSVGPYSIPADNPFVGATSFNGSAVDPDEVRTEFYAVGLRNPWRFSIDPLTGAIIVGDVGEGDFEELNSIVAGGNYGWPFREGAQDFRGGTPAGTTLSDPIHAYGRDAGLSVVGGFIYRGTALPELNGKYIFSDWGSGEIRALDPDGLNPVSATVLTTWSGFGPSAFAPDPRNGEILMTDASGGGGSVRQLVRNPNGTVDNLPPTLSATGAFSDLSTLTPNPGLVPYEINAPFWSDDAIKTRWFSIPDQGLTMGFDTETPWHFPASTVWIKHFEIDLERGNPSTRRRLETRFLVRTLDGIYGATYRWTGPTTATLVPEEGASETLLRTIDGESVAQEWSYPSRGSCLTCHTPAGGYALGFNALQLNCDQSYGSETHNQLDALDAMGYFPPAPPLPPARSLRKLVDPGDTTASTTHRARSWLHTNCSQCHFGSGVANWDARFTTPLGEAGILDALLNEPGSDPANRVVAPGDPAHSILLSRMATRGSGQMPPIASSIIDEDGVALLTAWINDLAGYQDYDSWSLAQLGFVAPKGGDEDADDLDNYGEYLLRLDPDNPAERWGIDSIQLAVDGAREIHFQRSAGPVYQIDWSDDLQNWHFLNVPGNEWQPSGTAGAATISDPTPQSGRRFYRARLIGP